MSSLPTGTVTFLFTDVEGSTRNTRRCSANTAAYSSPSSWSSRNEVSLSQIQTELPPADVDEARVYLLTSLD
jgi:hypothetical protein